MDGGVLVWLCREQDTQCDKSFFKVVLQMLWLITILWGILYSFNTSWQNEILHFLVWLFRRQLFRSSHFSFWFLVTFGNGFTKIRKHYIIFVYILDKTEKKENHTIKGTKIPKNKRQKYGMNKTQDSKVEFVIKQGCYFRREHLELLDDLFCLGSW